MDRYDYEERQKRRNQANRERSFSGDRYAEDEDRYERDDDNRRFSPQGNQDRYSSHNRSNERFNSGGNDRHEYRSQEDYRSPRDENRSQKFSNEYDQGFDTNLGGKSSSGRKGMDYGTNQPSSSFSRQRPDHSGGFGQNSDYENSRSNSQEYGRNFSQGYNSRSSYGSQQGQGNYNQGESRWGSESSVESKAGRGPKGYKRSDERIQEEISDLLTSHHEVDPSEVEIKVSAGEVTLTGSVSSRNEKRQIEDLASQIPGVSDVTNQLRVQPSYDSFSSSASKDSGQNKSSHSQGLSGQASTSQKEGSQQSGKSMQ